MAERVRFELTVLAYTRVPGVHLKPLGHLSIRDSTIISKERVSVESSGVFLNRVWLFDNRKMIFSSPPEKITEDFTTIFRQYA